MLGELLGESRGKVAAYRVLPTEGQAPKVEVSFQASGKLVGVKVRELGTYWSVARPDGTMYGVGQGVIMSAEGDTALWSGNGSGKLRPGGGAIWRGAVYYRAGSGKLSRLNGVVGIFEYDVDQDDNTAAKLWEWK